jgi:hypothetical protein
MADIFGIDTKFGGIFKGNSFSMTVSGAGDFAGALVQSLQIDYQRQVTRQWELGSLNQYYIEGRTEGQGQLNQIVGPKNFVAGIVRELGDICKVENRMVSLTAGQTNCNGAGGGMTMNLGNVLSTSISLGAQAENFLINTGAKIMFTSLDIPGSSNV